MQGAAPKQLDTRLLDRLERVSAACLVVAAIIAGGVLAGWLAPTLRVVLPPTWSLMKANTSLALLSCTVSAALAHNPRHSSRRRLLAAVFAVIALLPTLIALYEHATGRATGWGTVLAADDAQPIPGLMAVQTAFGLVLLVLTLLIDPRSRGAPGWLFDGALAALTLLVLVLLSGHIYSATNLVGQSSSIRTSPQTLACIALVAVAQLNRRAPHGFFALLVGVGIGSHFARLMIPFSMALAFLTIYVGERLFASGNLTLSNAAAMTAASMVAILTFLILLLAAKINRLEAELRETSISDELTHLYNLRGFHLLGGQALRDAQRSGRAITLACLDVDGLKAVNDTFGHDAGSEMLAFIAAQLRSTFRDNDVVARVGGDEFAVLTQGTQDDVAAALRRLDEALLVANARGGKPYRMSVSAGVAGGDAHDRATLGELLARADAAMYDNRRKRRSA